MITELEEKKTTEEHMKDQWNCFKGILTLQSNESTWCPMLSYNYTNAFVRPLSHWID